MESRPEIHLGAMPHALFNMTDDPGLGDLSPHHDEGGPGPDFGTWDCTNLKSVVLYQGNASLAAANGKTRCFERARIYSCRKRSKNRIGL